MAMELEDILQIVDVQQLFGQTCLNVFTYRVGYLEANTDYPSAYEAFVADIITPMTAIQCVDLEHTRVQIKNLTNEVDIFEQPHSIDGLASGSSATSILAWSFRLVRSTALTRHGQKRVAGVPEGQLAGNNPESTFQDELDAFAAALAGSVGWNVVALEGIILEPVIVGRVIVPGPTYGDYDLSKINEIQAAQFIRVSSQTTRRAGRGI